MRFDYPEPEPIGRARLSRPAPAAPLLRNSSGVSDLPVETPLEIEINGVPVATLICTPDSLHELVAGWCFGQGYIDGTADIARFTVRNGRAVLMLKRSLPGGHEWRAQLAAGFDASHIRFPDRIHGTPPKRDGFLIEAGRLLALAAELFERFRAAPGGQDLHHTGATDGHAILTTTHDIGRHNALDKLVGWSVLAQQPFDGFVVALSGRVCAASVFRAARAGIRLIVSLESPSAQAVKLAQGAGVTVVADLGSRNPTIYSHPWRIDRGAA